MEGGLEGSRVARLSLLVGEDGRIEVFADCDCTLRILSCNVCASFNILSQR